MENTLSKLAILGISLGFIGSISACEGVFVDDPPGSECTVSNTISTGPSCIDETDCPGEVMCVNETCRLKLHSEPCQSNNECLYGLCHSSPSISGSGFKICTKRCDCGKNSQCSDDNGEGNYYSCQRFSPNNHPDEELLSICTRTCGTGSSACPSLFNGCEIVTGAQKTCVFN